MLLFLRDVFFFTAKQELDYFVVVVGGQMQYLGFFCTKGQPRKLVVTEFGLVVSVALQLQWTCQKNYTIVNGSKNKRHRQIRTPHLM